MTEFRTLADDEKITEPGFYRISLDRHHSQPCDGISVTSGVLRAMELRNPEEVWATHRLNPNRMERPETDALRLGRAMAAFIENGMDGLREQFKFLPRERPNRPTEKQLLAIAEGRGTEAGLKSAEFWAETDADERQELKIEELEKLAAMGTQLARDPMAKAMMTGEPEVTMAWQDDATGIWCLARPDVVTLDGASADYKKISTQGNPLTHWLVDRRIEKHGYHMQMAFAGEALEQLTGEFPGAVGLVFQSDAVPYQVIPRAILMEDLSIARWLNQRALRRFHECYTSGNWPGPSADIGAYQMSDYLRERYLEEMQTEGVAP